MRWRLLFHFVPDYLRTTVAREWQLATLVLGGLAPGVAVLMAWLNLAISLNHAPHHTLMNLQPGWLLPAFLLERLGLTGVLIGAGVATLLVGCLGLANVYLASVEQRVSELALLRSLGLRKIETAILLLSEALCAGLLGSATGLLAGILLSRLVWPSAQSNFGIQGNYVLHSSAVLTALATGTLAALLFMGMSALSTLSIGPAVILRGKAPQLHPRSWQEWETALYGTLFAALLVLAAGLPTMPAAALMVLVALTVGLSVLLTGGGWLLTRFYEQLPVSPRSPLWQMALQGLARHPRHTAGLSLAMTAGSYAVGLALLALLDGDAGRHFAIWVAGGVLVAAAGLVLTAAALSAIERRREFGLLIALGTRPRRVRRIVLLEYGIVAAGGGVLGALLALINWTMAGPGNWWAALAIVVVDLVAALFSAWTGAIPVLWRVSRWSAGEALRRP